MNGWFWHLDNVFQKQNHVMKADVAAYKAEYRPYVDIPHNGEVCGKYMLSYGSLGL